VTLNDPALVRREYATEDRFLARRLASRADLDGPSAEDTMIAAIARTRPARVADVGCGTGDLSARVRDEVGTTLIGLDLSPRMARLARAKGLAAVQGDVEALPCADAVFDCALANRVLYHLPDLAQGIREIRRALRPGGTLVSVTYSSAHLAELWEAVGARPSSSTSFDAEQGTAALEAHFDRVERVDCVGTARFTSVASVGELIAGYGELVEQQAVRLDGIVIPFETTYRHAVFVAA
jgi:SAM-dependent methyltransferase